VLAANCALLEPELPARLPAKNFAELAAYSGPLGGRANPVLIRGTSRLFGDQRGLGALLAGVPPKKARVF